MITARNPFKKDEMLLDYEMDSEDEWAEQNGEDIDKKDVEEEQEDEEMANEDEEDAGFIVSDGHLSVCEYDFSDGEADDEKKQKEIALRRERLKQQHEQTSLAEGKPYCIHEAQNPENSSKTLMQFAILPFGGKTLPLSVKKPEKVYEIGQSDPNAILKYRPHLIRACYASLESKQQIVDVFNDKYPECSKKSIERVFKEIIIKEKREGDLRPVWYVAQSTLDEIPELCEPEGIAELASLATERMRPLLEEAEQAEATKNEEMKIREELKRLQQAQRDAEREMKEREKRLEKELQ